MCCASVVHEGHKLTLQSPNRRFGEQTHDVYRFHAQFDESFRFFESHDTRFQEICEPGNVFRLTTGTRAHEIKRNFIFNSTICLNELCRWCDVPNT